VKRQNFFVVHSSFFGSTCTYSCFSERFRNGQYSLVSFLYAVLLMVLPRAQPFVKMGARVPVPRGVGATVPELIATHEVLQSVLQVSK